MPEGDEDQPVPAPAPTPLPRPLPRPSQLDDTLQKGLGEATHTKVQRPDIIRPKSPREEK
jgi:hypothetical protein